MDIPALHTLTNGIIIGICLSISFGLVCFKQMAHAINPKYRRACHFFIAASLIIAAGHLAELLVDGFGVYRSLDLFSILVLVLASSQALMFTFMLILLFDSRYVTFANVMKHAAPSLVFILLYVVSCCIEADVCVYSLAEWRACVVHNLPLAVRTLFGVTYTVQLFVYVRLFFRKKHRYITHLKELTGECISKLELRWTMRAFLYALSIGIGAWVLLVFRDRYPSLVSVSLSWFSILLLHGCTLTIITLTRCYAVLSSNRMENCPNHRSKPIWATSSVTCNPAIATTCLKSSKPICRKNNRTSTTTSSVTT